MDVYISRSPADEAFARRLRDELVKLGVTVHEAHQVASGPEFSASVREGVAASDTILAVSSKQYELTGRLGYENSEALGAAWDDKEKRVIPVVIGAGAIPAFAYSAAADDSLEVVRVPSRRDVRAAANALLRLLSDPPGENGAASSKGRATITLERLGPPSDEGFEAIEAYVADQRAIA